MNSVNYFLKSILRDNFLGDILVSTLNRNEGLSLNELKKLQEKYVYRSLRIARNRIPAYKNITLPRSSDDILKWLTNNIPVIDKDVLLCDTSYYPSSSFKTCQIKGKTSGTTGTPLVVHRSFKSILWEYAFLKRHWKWFGFKKGMKRAVLRGDSVVDILHISPPFWHHNVIDNTLMLSTRHLSMSTAPYFVDELRKFQPYMLQAYPSAAYVLAQYLDSVGERLDIPFIFTGSEMLYKHQRDLIESRVGLIRDFYGMAERVALASECSFGNLHVNSDYSHVEIVDDKNLPTNDFGYVVGTTFHNSCMPLLRYRLSDMTRWKVGVCGCGCTYPMIEPIRGKYEDTLFDSTGSPVSPSIITFAFKGVKNIKKSQVVQVDSTTWNIKIVPSPDYSKDDGIRVVQNLHRSIDPNLSYKIVLSIDIPRTKSGKYRWVVNEWKSNSQTES